LSEGIRASKIVFHGLFQDGFGRRQGEFMNWRTVFLLISVLGVRLAIGQSQDLTLEQILQKNEDAVGGAEAIRKVQTIRTTAWIVGSDHQTKGILTISVKRPDLVRSELVTQGISILSAYDGTIAWTVNPLAGSSEPQRLDEPTLTSRDINLETTIGTLASLKAAGRTIELLGQEMVGKVNTYKLKVTQKNSVATYYVSAENFLPIKTVSTSITSGKERQVDALLLNYQMTDGIMFARFIEQKEGTRSLGQMIYDKIEINPPMEDNIFRMPASDPPPIKKNP
jgi:hypothetical protein